MSAEMDSNGHTSGDGHSNGVSNGYTNGIGKGVHLLLVPMVQQAHAVSAVRLAKKLSKRGVTVTLVMIKQHADELNQRYTQEALQTQHISIVSLDTYKPPPVPTPVDQYLPMKDAFQPVREKLIADKRAGLPGPTCILADRFLVWMEDVAKELDVPRFSFCSNAAMTLRLIQSYYEKEVELRSVPQGPDWFQNCFEILRKQPGLEFLKKASDIPPISVETGWFDFFCNIGRMITGSSGIVFNSFYALEHHAVEAMRSAFPGSDKIKVPPIFPIGPLSIAEEFNHETFVSGVQHTHAECMEWLGAQPSQSVLFICLGSQVRLFGEQILHLARALEESDCRFLWVLSKGKGNFESVEEVLPPGYLERVGSRGKIVTGWVGQLEILSNPALGGFVSHCGWQSVMETLTCGVPILGWPQVAEQPLNIRYLVEVLKVAVRVAEKEYGEIVEQHEFEQGIKAVMSEKERTVVAANSAKLKSMAAEAVAEGGRSDVALDQLIQLFSNPRRKN